MARPGTFPATTWRWWYHFLTEAHDWRSEEQLQLGRDGELNTAGEKAGDSEQCIEYKLRHKTQNLVLSCAVLFFPPVCLFSQLAVRGGSLKHYHIKNPCPALLMD